MKFLLINPTASRWRVPEGSSPRTSTKIFRYSMLTSLSVAAAVPPNTLVQILDEDIEAVDFDTDADLIGISFMTFNAPRAYEIADRFRKEKGKTVIMGGYHPTFLPDEALTHSDAVCIGEAEPNLSTIFADFQKGHLRQKYENGLADLCGLRRPDRSLIHKTSYSIVDAVQATRGCPYSCTYCSISTFFDHTFRARPVDEVIDELRSLGKYVLFLDDNLTVNREYARELFTAMIPLKKRWFSQCNVRIAYDGDLVDLAYNSGCRGLFIGLESLNQENLTSWGKHFGKTNEYRWAMDKIHRAGIGIISGIVFGHDGDTDSIFSETLQFLHDADIDALQATILTPFPGTPLFAEMERSHRIRSTDWGLYDFSNVVFEPLQMSAEALKAGHDRVLREFYSWRSVVRRTFRELAYLDPSTILHASLPLNLSYRARLHADGII